MKVIYTEQSLESLAESLKFLLEEQRLTNQEIARIIALLLDKADSLASNPYLGQIEEYLEHLEKGHRRVVEGHFKIIYRVEDKTIYITDFFDTRQDPKKMKNG